MHTLAVRRGSRLKTVTELGGGEQCIWATRVELGGIEPPSVE